MNIRYPAEAYFIIDRGDSNFLAIALTHPGTPRVKIAINDISDKWNVGEKVLFRADYNSNDEIFVPVSRAEIDYSRNSPKNGSQSQGTFIALRPGKKSVIFLTFPCFGDSN